MCPDENIPDLSVSGLTRLSIFSKLQKIFGLDSFTLTQKILPKILKLISVALNNLTTIFVKLLCKNIDIIKKG